MSLLIKFGIYRAGQKDAANKISNKSLEASNERKKRTIERKREVDGMSNEEMLGYLRTLSDTDRD